MKIWDRFFFDKAQNQNKQNNEKGIFQKVPHRKGGKNFKALLLKMPFAYGLGEGPDRRGGVESRSDLPDLKSSKVDLKKSTF